MVIAMPEWYVYERDGTRRKARAHEIPPRIQHGCDLTNGDVVYLDKLKPKKGSEKKDAHKKDAHKQNR